MVGRSVRRGRRDRIPCSPTRFRNSSVVCRQWTCGYVAAVGEVGGHGVELRGRHHMVPRRVPDAVSRCCWCQIAPRRSAARPRGSLLPPVILPGEKCIFVQSDWAVRPSQTLQHGCSSRSQPSSTRRSSANPWLGTDRARPKRRWVRRLRRVLARHLTVGADNNDGTEIDVERGRQRCGRRCGRRGYRRRDTDGQLGSPRGRRCS